MIEHLLTLPEGKTGVYVRLGSTSRQADPQLIGELRRSAQGLTFDEMPMPQLSVDDLGLRVRVVVYLAQALPTTPAVLPGTGEHTTPRLESRLESNLAAKVMLLLAEAEAGKAQLAAQLGHQSVSGELHKQIKRLLTLEFIEMTLPHKPNSRLQKYRLTALGHEQLTEK